MQVASIFRTIIGLFMGLIAGVSLASEKVVVIPLFDDSQSKSNSLPAQMTSGSGSFGFNQGSTVFMAVGYGNAGIDPSQIEIRWSVSGAVTDFGAQYSGTGNLRFTWLTNGEDGFGLGGEPLNVIRPPSLTCTVTDSGSCFDGSGCVEIEAGDMAVIRVSGGQPDMGSGMDDFVEGDSGTARWSAAFIPGGNCEFTVVEKIEGSEPN